MFILPDARNEFAFDDVTLAEYLGAKSYYYAGGQRVALWVKNQSEDDQLFYLLSDHLGSTSRTANALGTPNSELRYKAWGETRYSSGTTPTTYRFTGQREQAEFGLYFFNARWYDPYLSHFIQPDSVIPDPSNPGDFDRYAYARNNPVYYIDPDGHRPCEGEDMNSLWCSDITTDDLKITISVSYGWKVKGTFSKHELYNLLEVGTDIEANIDHSTGKWGIGWIRKYLGNAVFVKSKIGNLLNKILGSRASVPFDHTIVLTFFSKELIVHELAHGLDNNFGNSLGANRATWIGGGSADAMVQIMAGHPEACIPRFQCFNPLEYVNKIAGNDPWPDSNLIANNGVADDFAETFTYSIYDPSRVPPMRLLWMKDFIGVTAINIP